MCTGTVLILAANGRECKRSRGILSKKTGYCASAIEGCAKGLAKRVFRVFAGARLQCVDYHLPDGVGAVTRTIEAFACELRSNVFHRVANFFSALDRRLIALNATGLPH